VIGVRDFNGDGRADILFRRSDGMLAMFLMNGFTVLASQVLGVVGPDIVVLGLGDFNGDGRADLAFRRVSDGLMAIYLMNGFQILSITSLGTVGTEFSACYGQPPFAVAQAPASRTRIGGL
jgi:sRNA-binding regulator protein Hfq